MSKCDHNLELVSGEDLAEIDRSQREIAVRFEKSNEMLENCNAIMENHMAHIGPQLGEHAKTISLLKSDLDRVFRIVGNYFNCSWVRLFIFSTTKSRIRKLKSRIREKYPDELEAAEKEELERMPPPADNWFLHKPFILYFSTHFFRYG